MFLALKHFSNKIQHTDSPEPVSALGYPTSSRGGHLSAAAQQRARLYL